jgi:hypothetical protein
MSLPTVSVVVDNALTASRGRTQALVVLVVDSQEWIPMRQVACPALTPRHTRTMHEPPTLDRCDLH